MHSLIKVKDCALNTTKDILKERNQNYKNKMPAGKKN